jgi:2-methylcitrate dehydratase PrpD
MYLTEKVATQIADIRYANISNEALEKAKQCILDCVGVTVAGAVDPIKVPVMHLLHILGGAPSSTVIGIGQRTSVTNAALANGIFGHVLDYDDTNQMFIGHASAVIVPAILALAEKFGASGKDIITAYMAGTEVQWRLGEALVSHGDHYIQGWHSTGTVGAFGAAAAASKLLGLDMEATARALAIVASEAGGFQEQFGTHCKSFHAGRANEVGVRAALLAEGGFTGAKSALEGKVGYLKLIAQKYDLSKLDNFAKPWGILETSFGRGINLKAHPVCASGVGSIEGMQLLVRQHGITPDDIQSIDCGVRPTALNILMHHDPKSGLEAKFSVEYWMAAVLLDGRVGLAQLKDDNVTRPQVREITKRVRVYADPEITLEEARVKIDVKLKDGRVLKEEYFPPKGAPDNPMSEQELIEKFLDCAAWGRLPKRKAEKAIDILLRLEQIDTIAPLMEHIVTGMA